mgnify:CR=1 FL=1
MYDDKKTGFLFVLPFVLGVLLFKLFPFITSLALSFTQFDIIDPPVWVGLQNYRELFGDDRLQVVTMPELLRAYHRHRVTRVLASDYGAVLPPGVPHRADGFVGAVGVSFLTAV